MIRNENRGGGYLPGHFGFPHIAGITGMFELPGFANEDHKSHIHELRYGP